VAINIRRSEKNYRDAPFFSRASFLIFDTVAARHGPANGPHGWHTSRRRTCVPRHLRHRSVLSGSLAAIAVASAALTTAAASAAAVPRPASAAARATAGGAPRTLLLINGQQLALRRGPGGRPVTSVLAPASGGFSFIFITSFCQQASDVPAAALPFLGRGLDPNLFRVSALRQAERAGRLPVRVTYHGAGRPSLPGVTITHASGGTATGYLTTSSAVTFGTALTRQFIADHARGSYGTDGMFSGGLSIALAGVAPTPQPARPGFAQHTLTMHGTDLAGKADNGDDITVFNAGNCGKFGDPVETENIFRRGIAKFSVPTGNYWAVSDFIAVSHGGLTDHIVVLPQFSVARSTSVAVRERAASSKITLQTALPSAPQLVSFTLLRSGFGGSEASISWAESGGAFWVSPTSRKPTVGSLRTFTTALLTSPGHAAVPYAYNLDFAGPPGRIPSQHFHVRQSSLATVNERYYQDVPSTGSWTTFGGTADQLNAGISSVSSPLKLPGLQTQYFSAGPAISWVSSYSSFVNPNSFSTGGGQSGAPVHLRSGSVTSQDWNKYPLHPAPNVALTGDAPLGPQLPSAARTGNLLILDTTPFSDNQLGHLGSGFLDGPRTKPTGHFVLEENGHQLAAGPGASGPPAVDLSSRPSVIRYALTASRAGAAYPLSPASRTVWTWRSRPDRSATVSRAWICLRQSAGSLGLTRRCAVQPMMTLQYQVPDMTLQGTVPAGRQVIGITAGHLQLARAAAVSGAQVSVSFDGGQHWQAAAVSALGAGHFSAAFTAPAGTFVTLRVTARDAAGGSIAETIQRAYQTAS
jgi:hypothetical protein